MFNKIKKNSPKAWAKFIKYNERERPYCKPNSEEYVLSFGLASLIGHLELFFDEQGITITIETAPLVVDNPFQGKIFYPNNILWCEPTKSRTEAWQAAIPKAFEILKESL